MKCVLLVDCETVNPLYLTLRKNERAGIAATVTIPAGQVIENPEAWRLCAIGKATPADDECKNRVDAHMGNPARLALIGKIKALMAADGVKSLDARTKQWLEMMKKTYAAELGIEPAANPE